LTEDSKTDPAALSAACRNARFPFDVERNPLHVPDRGASDVAEALRPYRRRLLARPSFARAVDEARPYHPLFPLGAPDRD
jgi:hypothetical protein